MYRYVQLDENGRFAGISFLHSKISAPDVVEVDETFDPVGKIYINGKWENDVDFTDELPNDSFVEDISELTLLGESMIMNSLELAEIKESINSIGQGVVEIMLNQDIGGI